MWENRGQGVKFSRKVGLWEWVWGFRWICERCVFKLQSTFCAFFADALVKTPCTYT